MAQTNLFMVKVIMPRSKVKPAETDAMGEKNTPKPFHVVREKLENISLIWHMLFK